MTVDKPVNSDDLSDKVKELIEQPEVVFLPSGILAKICAASTND